MGSVFSVKSVQAYEENENIDILENHSTELEEVASTPLRPSKIWIPDVSLPYTGGVTHFYEVRKFGAIYRGTLDLKPGVYFGGSGIYRGYVYNIQLGPHHLKLKMEIE